MALPVSAFMNTAFRTTIPSVYVQTRQNVRWVALSELLDGGKGDERENVNHQQLLGQDRRRIVHAC